MPGFPGTDGSPVSTKKTLENLFDAEVNYV